MSTAYLPKTTSKNAGFSIWKPIRSIYNFLRGNGLFTIGLCLLLGLYLFGVIGSIFVDVGRADMGANPHCSVDIPTLKELKPDHWVSCHLYNSTQA